MSTMEILFLVFTVPGIYFAITLGVYKLYRKFISLDDDSDIGEIRFAAVLWIITLPFYVVVGGGLYVINYLFDMIDGGKDK